jgi:hypothetical protein
MNRPPHRASLTGCLVLTLAICGSVSDAAAQPLLEDLSRHLTFVSDDGANWVRLTGSGELTVYAPKDPAPGLLFSDATVFVAPRATMTLEAGLGERLLAHVRATADRGFDPGADKQGDTRFDEYFLQLELPDRGRTTVRAGKFATVFGQWPSRHRAWDNPLITAPALYEDMLAITDLAAPADPAAFAARRNAIENKPAWVPLVWGPSYATGASITTGTPTLDLAVEVKNASLSSRPSVWDAIDTGFDTDPTVTARVAWHPAMEWILGASWSRGPYLQKGAAGTLPEGAHVDDFDQTTAAVDLTYERHRLQLWAELAHATFGVPRVGKVDVTGAFLEARYKPAPRYWLAGRLNGTWFGGTPGLERSWDRNLSRLDLAVGYRHSAHIQAKVEYSIGNQAGRDTNGNRLLAAQLIVWF